METAGTEGSVAGKEGQEAGETGMIDRVDILARGYRKAIAWIEVELRSLKQMALAAKVIARVSPGMQRLLNFAHDWRSSHTVSPR